MPRPFLLTSVIGAGVLSVLALAFGRSARHFAGALWSEYRTFYPHRGPVALPDSLAELGFVPVAFAVTGVGTIRGWQSASHNGAAVALLHGMGADRREVLDAAVPLARAGYGVLVFDGPGHGESEGRARFGEPERGALRAALDSLARAPGVGAGRVGVYGFSMGAFIAAQVAPDDARVGAVVLAAPPGDVVSLTRQEYARGGPAAQRGALLANRLVGVRFDEPPPLTTIPRLAPRPLLILTGAADPAVPPAAARAVYDAAGAPKRLWIIAGARHGGYGQVERDYGERVRAFFDQALARPR